MSKAEERALKAYPVFMTTLIPTTAEHPLIEQDCNTFTREAYIKGYRQAEKDLELSWEDMRIILDAENDILRECNGQKELVIETYPKEEDYYSEILKRFKDYKERKEK